MTIPKVLPIDRTILSGLAVFAEVARARSFRKAGTNLGLSASAVSHALRGLEAQLGVRLVARTTRSVAPTTDGQQLLDRIGPAFADVAAAVGAIREQADRPSGTVRVTLPRSAADEAFALKVATFCNRYPDIVLDLDVNDRLVDVVAEGFDCGVRLGETVEQDMVAVRISPALRMIAVASPALLAGRRVPRHPRDLATLPCVGMRFESGAMYQWEFERDGVALRFAARGPVVVNDDRLLIDIARHAGAVGFVFETLAAPYLADRSLVRLLDDWSAPFPGFHLYYPSRRQMRPSVRLVIDHFAHQPEDASNTSIDACASSAHAKDVDLAASTTS
jgi:DNA-binding transcriptional LysR family regulator